ncbi:MAG: deoxyribodipyrimidine photo-lyase, partial [Verrucomicrobiae bacterium]|nr:deoxyribodipyrimidine photo-lyase [Verrucomicrobiae bacterium]
MKTPVLVWFRNDLRLADNPALQAAMADENAAVIPVFIWAPEEEAGWSPGAASRWWMHQSLCALEQALRHRGSRLIIRRGPSLATLHELCRETGARQVVWNRRYEPGITARDAALKQALRAAAIQAASFNGSLLHEPWEIRNKSGGPFQVFTAFWKRCLEAPEPPPPRSAPERLGTPADWPASLPLESLGLEPRIDWAGGIRRAWTPGEAGGARALQGFLDRAFTDY